jgi:hypothetical protein
MNTKITIWKRVGHVEGIYYPSQDSPENHYINQTVVDLLLQFTATLRPTDEQHIANIKTLFRKGLDWKNIDNLTRNVPRKLAASLIATRVKISNMYAKSWRRPPYAEEYNAIWKKANKWR